MSPQSPAAQSSTARWSTDAAGGSAFLVAVVLLLVCLSSGLAGAQETGAEEPEPAAGATVADDGAVVEADESEPPAAADESAVETASIQALEERLEALEQENARQAEEIAELKQRAADEDEAAFHERFGAIQEFEPTFDIYGFFSVSARKWFIEEGDGLNMAVPDSLTFIATDLNLYFLSHMTESLSALAELRFTFLPHGVEGSMLDAERENTTVSDPYTWEETQLGGVVIERVHFTWQPRDWFALTGGRFITPFGIWNEDHGSPVLLPSYPPYMMLRQTIPTRQTGFMVHGRAVPWETLFFDYALTLSNGRGPTERVYDLDDNKAVGLRLRATYERENFLAAIGGYGFYGTTTDIRKYATNVFPPEFQIEQTERYKEVAGAADLLIQIFGVRLQAEYARGLVRYTTRPIRVYPVANVQSPYGELQPDHVRWDAYVLLAWTLPLDALLGDMKLTPFVMWDQSEPDDTIHDFDIRGLRGGLNFKPNSFIAIKADFIHVDFYRSRLVEHDSWIVSGQVAVAF